MGTRFSQEKSDASRPPLGDRHLALKKFTIMSNRALQVGDGVRRIGTKDQVCGRTGNVVAIYPGGAQVQWIYEPEGYPRRLVGNSAGGFTVKTKVRSQDLQLLAAPIDLAAAKNEWNAAIDAGTLTAKKVKVDVKFS